MTSSPARTPTPSDDHAGSANILGANAWGTSLIVGDGSTFPDCMQHQVANLAGSLNGSSPVLAGAAVEGPNSFAATGVVTGMRTCPANGVDTFAQFNSATAVFQDNVQSWSTDRARARPHRLVADGIRVADRQRPERSLTVLQHDAVDNHPY